MSAYANLLFFGDYDIQKIIDNNYLIDNKPVGFYLLHNFFNYLKNNIRTKEIVQQFKDEIKLLVEYGYDINMKAHKNDNLLAHYYCMVYDEDKGLHNFKSFLYDFLDIFYFLIDIGSDVNIEFYNPYFTKEYYDESEYEYFTKPTETYYNNLIKHCLSTIQKYQCATTMDELLNVTGTPDSLIYFDNDESKMSFHKRPIYLEYSENEDMDEDGNIIVDDYSQIILLPSNSSIKIFYFKLLRIYSCIIEKCLQQNLKMCNGNIYHLKLLYNEDIKLYNEIIDNIVNNVFQNLNVPRLNIFKDIKISNNIFLIRDWNKIL